MPKIKMSKEIFRLARSGNLPMDGVEYINIGFQNPMGQTIAHIIAKRGCLKEIKYLVERGCPVWLSDHHGTTPYDIAQKRKHKALVAWFLNQDTSSIPTHQRNRIGVDKLVFSMPYYWSKKSLKTFLGFLEKNPELKEIKWEGRLVIECLKRIEYRSRPPASLDKGPEKAWFANQMVVHHLLKELNKLGVWTEEGFKLALEMFILKKNLVGVRTIVLNLKLSLTLGEKIHFEDLAFKVGKDDKSWKRDIIRDIYTCIHSGNVGYWARGVGLWKEYLKSEQASL